MPEIQSYNHEAGSLQQPQSHKVKKLLALGCLKKAHQDLWLCRPILGYNTTTYRLIRTPTGDFQCECQGYHKYGHCSHLTALHILMEKEGDVKQGSLF